MRANGNLILLYNTDQVARLLEVLTRCYKIAQKYDEASQCLQRVIVIKELLNNGTPEASIELFNLTGQLAEVYFSSGQGELASTLLSKTEESAIEVFGEASFERGKCLCSLAVAQQGLGQIDQAVATLEKAIGLEGYGRTTVPAQKSAASIAFFNLGVIQFDKHLFPEALVNFQKAAELKRQSGVRADDVADIVEFIARTEAAIASPPPRLAATTAGSAEEPVAKAAVATAGDA
jgi:tetratricopeptide (TPR) repeat protein